MTIMDHDRRTSHDTDAADALVAAIAARHTDLGQVLRHRARTTPDALFIRFLAYDVDPAGVAADLCFAEADRRVDAVAARLARVTRPGDRVAVLTAQGNDFVVGFLAALRAGLVAVPLFSPDLPGHGDRLRAVLADCTPAVALATRANRDVVTEFLASPTAKLPVLTVDAPDEDDAPAAWQPPTIDPTSVAYLQYTSGSTRLPAGVRITHRNIVFNGAQEVVTSDAGPASTLVTWLPLFHDMGLVSVVGASLMGGMPTVLMDPIAFLMRPQRWLEQLAAADRGISAAPNFAFDFCAKRIPQAERDALDLSGIGIIFNGAEPVTSATLERFYEAFAATGLPRGCVSPSYGLAEATVYVTNAAVADGVRYQACDSAALSLGRVEPPGDGATTDLVLCGTGAGNHVAIVDPATGERLPVGRVGEIWIHSDSVGDGYWERPDETAAVFGQTLRAAGELPTGGWLRSGDLGTLVDGALAVTGRIKDLVIVDGRNHYPQDLERVAEDAHEVIGRHRTAAFAVTSPEGERAVLVAEVSRHHVDGDWDVREVTRAVTRAVSREHGVALHRVVLVAPDTIARTTSGKIARASCRQAYLTDELTVSTGASR